jgi:hypothetical protein
MFRLPTEPRTVTNDQLQWANEWNALADMVVEFFPGYRVAGMDPGVMLFPVDGSDGTVSLPLRACLALLSTKETP